MTDLPVGQSACDLACGLTRHCCAQGDEAIHSSSFRDGPKDQTRNLEIPGSMLRIAPE
jgi:hypothetical protein